MNSDNNCGYIKIDKDILKTLCEKCIKYIYDVRKRKEERSVKDFIEEWNKKAVRRNKIPLIGKWFHIQELSDIEQTKRLMDMLYLKCSMFEGNEYCYDSNYARYVLEKAENVLECCNNKEANSEILLSIEMYQQILLGQK